MQREDTGQRDDSHPTWDGVSFHHPAQNSAKENLGIISGVFHLTFLDHCFPWVTETVESKTAGTGELL